MSKLEKLLGHDKYMALKQRVKYIRDKKFLRNHDRIEIQNSEIEIEVLEQAGRHVFFGYYDIAQLNSSETMALVQVIPEKADTKEDRAELGWYNTESLKYTKFGETNAWSWQQGARLRWWPGTDEYVAYNDVEDNKYVCKKVSILSGKVERVFCRALYDIAPTGEYGLSLNFSRLQRLRPGYGYSTLPDDSIEEDSSNQDGIFYVDLLKNNFRLIISLAELAQNCGDKNALQHYINHISISPDGNKFMFFHIWTLKDSPRWKTRLCVANKDGSGLIVLETVDQVSHYDWIDDRRLLITGYTPERKQIYSIYDIESGKKSVLDYPFLDRDGHPSVLRDKNIFVTDTYPKAYDMQALFECNIAKKTSRPLLQIYSTPLMYEEKRCDLHPRISESERFITIDSTFKDNLRKVVVIKNWKE